MASSYSDLKIELIATGEQSGTWGSTTNTNLGTALEEAITGRAAADFTSDADLTLGYTDSNAAQVFRNLILNVTSGFGSLTATRNLIVPTINKVYIVENNTTGGQDIVVKTSAGTGITVPNGSTTVVYADGTNVVSGFDHIDSMTLSTALSVASGGTGASALTLNNVILGNGTSPVQFVSPGASGNILTSDGTTWASSAPAPGGIDYVVKTANYTTQNNEGVLADTSGGAFTVTLPASPTTGDQVVVADPTGDWGTNNLTVGRNGETISDVGEDLVCDISGASVQLVYDGTTWAVYAQVGGNGGTVVTLTGTQTLTNKTLTAPVITTVNISGGTIDNASIGSSTANTGNFSTLSIAGTAISATAAEINYLDITTLGTSEASKALTADANGDVIASAEFRAVSYNETLGTITSSDLDLETGNVFNDSISANTTYTFSNPPASGTAFGFTLKVTVSGTRTITWPAAVDWAGGSAPDAPAAGETDVFAFYTTDGGTTYYGFLAGDAMA